jgi:preprotein translocase SecE subunit
VADAIVQVGPVTRFRTFVSDVMGEMRRVTWPDTGQVRQLSIGVIILSLVVGGVIGILDLVFQQVLVKLLPSLFGG